VIHVEKVNPAKWNRVGYGFKAFSEMGWFNAHLAGERCLIAIERRLLEALPPPEKLKPRIVGGKLVNDHTARRKHLAKGFRIYYTKGVVGTAKKSGTAEIVSGTDWQNFINMPGRTIPLGNVTKGIPARRESDPSFNPNIDFIFKGSAAVRGFARSSSLYNPTALSSTMRLQTGTNPKKEISQKGQSWTIRHKDENSNVEVASRLRILDTGFPRTTIFVPKGKAMRFPMYEDDEGDLGLRKWRVGFARGKVKVPKGAGATGWWGKVKDDAAEIIRSSLRSAGENQQIRAWGRFR